MPRQHVQNYVAITVLESMWEWNEISIEFELRWTKPLVKRGPGPGVKNTGRLVMIPHELSFQALANLHLELAYQIGILSMGCRIG